MIATYGHPARFLIRSAPGGRWLVFSPLSEPAPLIAFTSYADARDYVAARLAVITNWRRWASLRGLAMELGGIR